jgi:NAD(P)-dependent dehydrogenase (short-subunit alcohol dehydrogenase family)
MNKKEVRSAIIISASSDIGMAITQRWLAQGWHVYGTYRRKSPMINELERKGVQLIFCDLSYPSSIREACCQLNSLCPSWDVLIMCPGTQEPIGYFVECDFDQWEESVKTNFTSQMRIVHALLPSRHLHTALGPCVLFFAGGGTNDAPTHYSAYIISKIALMKMCELLDAEIPDTRFCIVGPGWVKTKIHDMTLKAGSRAGPNYQRTLNKLTANTWVPMEKVLDCCDWLINFPRELVSGRNFSVVYDQWNTKELEEILKKDSSLYKLRRYGNDRLVKNENER